MKFKKHYPFSARATQYARDVVDGKIIAGRLTVLACARHLADLKRAEADPAFPYEYDPAKGDRICAFASNLVHVKGKWAASEDPRIKLEDWQCFMLAVPFGWVNKSDGLRRFCEVYAEVARKNGKSIIAAIVGLYMMLCDGEPGAEVYAGATSEKQAMEVFRPAWLMTKKTPSFAPHFGVDFSGTVKNPGPLYRIKDVSRFEAVVHNPGDGASPHCGIVDEYHEHRTPDLYDTFATGMGARSQPLLFVITTAGKDTSGPCYAKRTLAKSVLEGSVENDTLFAIIYTLDDDDDWTDFEVWKKANPNIGVSVHVSYLQKRLAVARQSPETANVILCKHLNRWTNAGSAWLDMVKYAAAADTSLDVQEFMGVDAFAAMDLANKIDLAALVIFVRASWGWAMFAKHYLPEETVNKDCNAHYRQWRDQGWLTVTDGARTDFGRIEDDLREFADVLAIQELAFDPREASYFVQQIGEWASFECVEVPQSPAHISEPMKELEAALYNGEIRHNGDPLLAWQFGNVIRKKAKGGGEQKAYYPTKETGASKIDAAVAAIMAMSRAKAAVDCGQSIYETQEGLL
ncbi:MAG: terminase large subunit [Desulfovibrionaceae bacterium]